MEIGALTEELCEAARATRKPELDLKGSERDAFAKFVGDLLAMDRSLGTIAKGRDLLTENQRCYCQARIVTDVRPIFAADAGSGPQASVVVHMLKISYHEGRDLKDFFVALDSDDVKELRLILDRSLSKAEALRQTLAKTGMPCLRLDSHGEDSECH
jgi:hypothetical protein